MTKQECIEYVASLRAIINKVCDGDTYFDTRAHITIEDMQSLNNSIEIFES